MQHSFDTVLVLCRIDHKDKNCSRVVDRIPETLPHHTHYIVYHLSPSQLLEDPFSFTLKNWHPHTISLPSRLHHKVTYP